jgi:hypothetical protein
MAILFVAFAIVESNPANISTGRAKTEPPPARVFMNPAKIPATNKKSIFISFLFSYCRA